MEEELIPEPAYLLQKRRVHVKRHFCNHCAATATTTATAGARGFDWQGLTAHMKARSVRRDGFVGKLHFGLRFISPAHHSHHQALHRQAC